MIKGGIAPKLCCTRRRVIGDVVDHRGTTSSQGLPERRGGRNSKYIASKCITGQHADLDVF